MKRGKTAPKRDLRTELAARTDAAKMTSENISKWAWVKKRLRILTRINEVVHQRQENQNDTRCKECGTNDGDDPVNRRTVGPCEPEQTNRQQNRAQNRRWQSSLGRSHATRGDSHNALVSLVIENAAHSREAHTDGNTNESETANARAPATSLLENNREGSEAHIQGSVDDSHVDGSQEDNGLLEEEDPWAGEGNLELAGDGLLGLAHVHSANVNITSSLGQLGGAAAQQNGGVCLGVQESAENPEDATENGSHTLNPAPAFSLTEETTGDGTQSRTEERSHGEDAGSDTSLRGGEHVGNDTTGVGERRGTESTSKESQDNKSSHGRSAGGTSVESSQSHVSKEEELLAAIQFGEGSPDQRTNGETQNEHGDTENDDFLGDVESLEDFNDTARVGGTGE